MCLSSTYREALSKINQSYILRISLLSISFISPRHMFGLSVERTQIHRLHLHGGPPCIAEALDKWKTNERFFNAIPRELKTLHDIRRTRRSQPHDGGVHWPRCQPRRPKLVLVGVKSLGHPLRGAMRVGNLFSCIDFLITYREWHAMHGPEVIHTLTPKLFRP